MNELFRYSKSLSLITHVQSTAQGLYQISGSDPSDPMTQCVWIFNWRLRIAEAKPSISNSN